ncbi:MAG: hypothetical protein RI557_00600 [Salibacter sp.]|nr:hypothetical protein [Salibacter sp.]
MNTGEVFEQIIYYWKKKNSKGKDVSDVLFSKLYLRLNQNEDKSKVVKNIYYPFLIAANRYPNIIQEYFGLNSNNIYPQVYIIFI